MLEFFYDCWLMKNKSQVPAADVEMELRLLRRMRWWLLLLLFYFPRTLMLLLLLLKRASTQQQKQQLEPSMLLLLLLLLLCAVAHLKKSSLWKAWRRCRKKPNHCRDSPYFDLKLIRFDGDPSLCAFERRNLIHQLQ